MEKIKIVCAIMATALFASFATSTMACGDGKKSCTQCAKKCHCSGKGSDCQCSHNTHS